MWWLENFLKEICVYWNPPKKDGYGADIWEYPKEIKCRWEEIQREIIVDSGQSLGSRGMIRTIYPVLVGGYVFDGRLSDFSNPVVPPYTHELFGFAIVVPGEPWQQRLAARIIDAQRVTALSNKDNFYIKATVA